jgi:hypothetical protein
MGFHEGEAGTQAVSTPGSVVCPESFGNSDSGELAVSFVLIPVAYGELIDKITILEIKAERLEDASKRVNVERELALLRETWAADSKSGTDISDLHQQLHAINARLWDIEEGKRACERERCFDASFVELARQVYIGNDERARIKRAINERLGSSIVEEKSYRDYGAPPA